MTRSGREQVPAAYARTFASDPAWTERFEAIGVEARERGLDPFSPEDFARLAESRAALRHLLTGDEDPEVRTQLGALLFQSWHFSRGGERVTTTSPEAAAALVAGGPPADWQLSGDPAAGFVRLPSATFHTPGSPGGLVVWMDGFFWTLGHGKLVLLVVLAADSGDFTLLPLPPLPISVAGLWATESVRQGDEDFAPEPEGPGPYGIAVAGEMLKLAIRALWGGSADDAEGDAAESVDPPDPASEPEPPNPQDA